MNDTNRINTFRLFANAGEMGKLICQTDWSKTSLGPLDRWPASLLTALGIVLHSKLPMLIFWGPESICFYNDAYRPSLGDVEKNADFVGKRASDCWPEVWSLIKPLLHDVMQGRESVLVEDQLLYLCRNGKMEYVYWSYSYSAITDEDAKIVGVFVACNETTGKVKNLERLEAVKNKFRDTVEQAPVAMCILKGPQYIVETANTMMIELMGKTADQVINKKVFEGVPEASGQGFEETLERVYTKGERFVANGVPAKLARGNAIQTIFVNYIFEPLREIDGSVIGITVVANDVTNQVLAKQAVEKSEARFRNLIEQSPVAMAIFKGQDFIIEHCNQSLLKNIWRKQLKEVKGRKLMDVFPEMGHHQLAEIRRTVLVDGISYKQKEVRTLIEYTSGKKVFFLDYEYTPLFLADDIVPGVMLTVNDVTEKVDAREKIEDAAERLQLATEGSQTATWDLDLVNGEIIHSPRLSIIFGYNSSEKFTHKQLRDKIHPDDLQNIVQPAFDKATKNGVYYYEARVILPDKSTRWVKTRGKIIFDSSGKPFRMLGTMVDVTDQRQTEEDLLKLAAIVQSSDDAIISKLIDGTIISWNDSARRLFGYSLEEVIGQSISKLIPPDRQNEEIEILSRLRNGERVEHFKTQRLTKSGTLLDLSLTISPIRNRLGQIIGASKIARDISSQLKSEKIIAENEERLKIILDASGLGTYELNLLTLGITYSDRYAEMLGQKTGVKVDYTTLMSRLHPDDLPNREQAFQQALKTGVLEYETRVILEDGSVNWIEARGKMFYDDQGNPVKLIGTSRDITHQKLYNERLEESERRFRSVADTAPVMIWLTDLDKKAIFLNKCWCDFTGIPMDQGLNHGWAKVVHPDDFPATVAAFTKAYETRTNYAKELRILGKDGRYHWIQDHAAPRYDTDGAFVGFIGTSVDVDQQKNLNRILENKVEERTADLLEANEQLIKTNHELEQFAYVSSHDLQEPLRKIQTFSEMLAGSVNLNEKSATYLEKIKASALRMSTLIKDLLNYSRLSKTDEKFVKTDLNEVLQNIKTDFEILIMQKNASIINTGLPVINAIPVQINQLFYNLVSNSLKFSETEPIIQISSLMLEEEDQKNVPGLRAGDKYVHLIFEDNGIGFSQTHADQIFVIFQRLNDKQKYSGTGIGLALCKKIVENHHGYISAKGELDKGARFDIYLPV